MGVRGKVLSYTPFAEEAFYQVKQNFVKKLFPMKLLWVLLGGMISLFPTNHQTSELEVLITGLKNQDGKLRVCLFNQANGFPSEAEKALECKACGIESDSVSVLFSNLSFGTYALAVLHDENDNAKMDANFFGMPREGYGCSNNHFGGLRPPRFEKAAFPVNATKVRQSVNLKY